MMDRRHRNGKLNLLIRAIRFFYWLMGDKHVYNSKSPVALPGAVSAPSSVALPPRTDASAAPVTAPRHCCARHTYQIHWRSLEWVLIRCRRSR